MGLCFLYSVLNVNMKVILGNSLKGSLMEHLNFCFLVVESASKSHLNGEDPIEFSRERQRCHFFVLYSNPGLPL